MFSRKWMGLPDRRRLAAARRVGWRLVVALGLVGDLTGWLPGGGDRAWGQPAAPASTQTLAERLTDLIEDHEGEVAVAVEHLETHEQFLHRADEPMPTASLIKFPIMIEAYRQAEAGMIDFDQMLELKQADKVPGAGILTPHFSVGSRFALRDAIRLMIAFSDNTATNLVIDQIGLPATSRAMEELGCPETRLHSKVYLRETSIAPERSRQFGLGSTTANEMLKLFKLLNAGELVTAQASAAMKAHLLTCDDKLKFPKLLPEGTKLAFKTGSVEAARTAAGLMETPKGTVVLCVLTAENEDKSWGDENEGDLLCARIAREVYVHFNPPPKDSTEADGGGCEEAAELRDQGVTADESGAIEAGAVGVEEGGLTDEATAGAGEIQTVAGSTLKPLPARESADSLKGRPFTSCQVWAIANARDGSVLWSSAGAGTAREVASTTKVMTALVALKMVEKEPGLLQHTVTFDETADRVEGSSCDLKAGDRLPLGELLYGMLLPSGNDAAVAVGRFLGRRLEGEGKDPLGAFIGEMNREAKRLGLRETKYVNPHGLPSTKHSSSARDLARITEQALRHRLFREIVKTREHSAKVTTGDGGTRKVTWRNTNRLLGVEGYEGVKTGYTRAAGSCLVSCGKRGSDELIVVVLGAPSAGAAASDSRNLYRWAWNERGHQR